MRRKRPGRMLLQWTKLPCAHEPPNISTGWCHLITKRKPAGLLAGGPSCIALCCGLRAHVGNEAVCLIAATKTGSKDQSPQAHWGPFTRSHLPKVPPPSSSAQLRTTPLSWGLRRFLQISQKQPQCSLLSSSFYVTETQAFGRKGTERGEASPWWQNADRAGTPESWCLLFLYGPLALGLLFLDLLTNKALEGPPQRRLYVLFPSSTERASQKITSHPSLECALKRLLPVTGTTIFRPY